jgi:CheY-like chemotaxis protein
MQKNLSADHLIVKNREILDHITEMVMKMITAVSDCGKMALRLRNAEDDFPFYFYQGYSEDFIKTENSIRAKHNGIEKQYECLCGYILEHERTDASIPLTAFGSYYTNSFHTESQKIKSSLFNPRTICMTTKDHSSAWIPVKKSSKTTGRYCDGLILLSDDKDLGFDEKIINRIEKIAENYAEIYHRLDSLILKETALRLNIIIADDNDAINQLLKKILSNFGHRITIAQNGQDAWEEIQSQRYDLVITDLHMPVLDGFGLIKKIRDEYKIYGPRIIILTGSQIEILQSESKKWDISAVVRKPLTDIFVLQRIICDIFQNG